MIKEKTRYVLIFVILLPTASCSGIENIAESEKNIELKIITYNIRHGEGTDGEVNLERISKVINKEDPDIALLQEVDKGVRRSSGVNQARKLSSDTEMKHYFFGKNINYQGGEYGNLTMSKPPPQECINIQLPNIYNEQRGVVKCVVKTQGKFILVLNVHMEYGDNHHEREESVDKIKEVILNSSLNEYDLDAVFLAGDFNSDEESNTHSEITTFLRDSWSKNPEEGYTISSKDPTRRIDYIFHSDGAKLEEIKVIKTSASDHLPISATFILK